MIQSDFEREAFAKLIHIAETESRSNVNRNVEPLGTYFVEFPQHSEPPGFYVCGKDLIIESENSMKALGRRSPVSILVVPSLRAILSDIKTGMDYQDALWNLANFPSGNIQEFVIQNIKATLNPAVKINAILSLRRVRLKRSTTRYLADQLRRYSKELKLAALFALQPDALGDDLSGFDGNEFRKTTPIRAEYLRHRRNEYDVDYVLSAIKSGNFESKTASLLLSLLSAPQFVNKVDSFIIVSKLNHRHTPTQQENAFISYYTEKILREGKSASNKSTGAKTIFQRDFLKLLQHAEHSFNSMRGDYLVTNELGYQKYDTKGFSIDGSAGNDLWRRQNGTWYFVCSVQKDPLLQRTSSMRGLLRLKKYFLHFGKQELIWKVEIH